MDLFSDPDGFKFPATGFVADARNDGLGYLVDGLNPFDSRMMLLHSLEVLVGLYDEVVVGDKGS